MNRFCRCETRVKRVSGFTLVELMLVVAIIGTLATFALPALSKAVLKSRLSELVGEIGEFRTQYEVTHQSGEIDVFGFNGYSMVRMPEELQSSGIRKLDYPGLNFSVVPLRSSQGKRLGLLIVDHEGTNNIEVLADMLPQAVVSSSAGYLLSLVLLREND